MPSMQLWPWRLPWRWSNPILPAWAAGLLAAASGTDGLQTFVDARETAPGAASATMYQDKDGKVMRDWAVNGPSAAGIPGQAAAFAHLADNYGKLPLTSTLAPAIALATDGFRVEDHYRKLAGYREDVLNRFPEAAAIFLHNGKVPPNNHLIQQPDLARVLTAIAEKGNAGFYQGEVAKQLVDGVQQAGGIWTWTIWPTTPWWNARPPSASSGRPGYLRTAAVLRRHRHGRSTEYPQSVQRRRHRRYDLTWPSKPCAAPTRTGPLSGRPGLCGYACG